MAYRMKGSPMHRNFGIGSPAKDRVTDLTGMSEKQMNAANSHNNSHAKGDDPHSPAKQRKINTTIDDSDEMKNESGKTQSDIMNMRDDSVKKALDRGQAFSDHLSKTYPDGFPSQGSMDKANAKNDELNLGLTDAQEAYTFSSDSINDVNKKKAEATKKSNEAINFDDF